MWERKFSSSSINSSNGCMRRQQAGKPELIPALRQSDGVRVQSLVLVRDDFWMAVTRFMRAFEVPLVEGGNSG